MKAQTICSICKQPILLNESCESLDKGKSWHHLRCRGKKNDRKTKEKIQPFFNKS